MKLLYVMGGMLFGDTFHCIPYINKFIKDGYNDITWVSGTYAQKATELIASQSNSCIKKTIYLEDGFPSEFENRTLFITNFFKNRDKLNLGTFDKEIIDPNCSLDWKYEQKTDLYNFIDFNWDMLNTTGDYICVQQSSCHAWKSINDLQFINFNYPIKSLGLPNEPMIPDSEDYRGIPMAEVLKLLQGCKFFIGAHSALACLSLYLNKPAIVCHFAPDLLKFNLLRKNMIDVFPVNKYAIQEAINKIEEII